jgi:hypothetical protein
VIQYVLFQNASQSQIMLLRFFCLLIVKLPHTTYVVRCISGGSNSCRNEFSHTNWSWHKTVQRLVAWVILCDYRDFHWHAGNHCFSFSLENLVNLQSHDLYWWTSVSFWETVVGLHACISICNCLCYLDSMLKAFLMQLWEWHCIIFLFLSTTSRFFLV